MIPKRFWLEMAVRISCIENRVGRRAAALVTADSFQVECEKFDRAEYLRLCKVTACNPVTVPLDYTAPTQEESQ